MIELLILAAFFGEVPECADNREQRTEIVTKFCERQGPGCTLNEREVRLCILDKCHEEYLGEP